MKKHNCIIHGYQKGECAQCRETNSNKIVSSQNVSKELRPDRIKKKFMGETTA